ncbi:MAG TPA: 2-amino-4-hydroxy-6-hydroxymethyldihydropteridine diphosphokinase [Gaiellaceae bacterium]|nr:2-amino-4-hydroxy-6-hydroxymethyldihydropteridine diphosphokinase [Gaiellaceae bacterium]
MTVAYIGLGANVGPREVTLLRAVDLLAEADDVEVLAVSQLRETDPVGIVDQPRFLNGAVRIDTSLPPRALLELLLRTEQTLGRVREERWGPRTVDLDLLVYGDVTVEEPGLHVPHPRLHERRFALEPLVELDPELVVPGLGSVSSALAALD